MKSVVAASPAFALAAGLVAGIAVLTVPSDVQASLVTLTMDEVSTQPINGLTISKGGELFTFTDPGGGLDYDSTGPGTLTFVQDPSIQGANEPFSVTFATPVNSITFGLAELAGTALTGASVTLSDGSVHSFDLSLVDPFAEGQFTYSGAAVTGLTLTPVAGPTALAFDNLTVNTVPEPVSITLLGVGIAGLGLIRRKRT